MEPELAAKFPEIKTYLAKGIDDPNATARFDLSDSGFHAQILSPAGAYYVEPCDLADETLHVSYYKHEYQKLTGDFQCAAVPEEAAKGDGVPVPPTRWH